MSTKEASMQFEMTHNFFTDAEPERFTEHDAPDWLTSANQTPGGTMDNRWFWNGHVLTLAVGATVQTEFRTIKRVA